MLFEQLQREKDEVGRATARLERYMMFLDTIVVESDGTTHTHTPMCMYMYARAYLSCVWLYSASMSFVTVHSDCVCVSAY